MATFFTAFLATAFLATFFTAFLATAFLTTFFTAFLATAFLATFFTAFLATTFFGAAAFLATFFIAFLAAGFLATFFVAMGGSSSVIGWYSVPSCELTDSDERRGLRRCADAQRSGYGNTRIGVRHGCLGIGGTSFPEGKPLLVRRRDEASGVRFAFSV